MDTWAKSNEQLNKNCGYRKKEGSHTHTHKLWKYEEGDRFCAKRIVIYRILFGIKTCM